MSTFTLTDAIAPVIVNAQTLTGVKTLTGDTARRETGLSPPVKHFYLPFRIGASFLDHLCYFCLVFVMLSCASVYYFEGVHVYFFI